MSIIKVVAVVDFIDFGFKNLEAISFRARVNEKHLALTLTFFT